MKPDIAKIVRQSAADVPHPADAPERLTMDLSRASVIRDPRTGKLMARETEVFRKWRACLAS
ncbi:hypothetical protein [Mameliella sediminis]|uniref:hypothetical protein n=1 Tax=Mameliella sediminis TaxID=2836866 RepID=UPI001C4692D2|nr:hypothetical protein [Mameliella sediminis]MBV7394649.1 hypothetical protein [Mameliella sediminis]